MLLGSEMAAVAPMLVTLCVVEVPVWSVLGPDGSAHPTPATASDQPIKNELLKEICTNFHELSVLTGVRSKLDSFSPLPYHLASLHVVDRTLSLKDVTLD